MKNYFLPLDDAGKALWLQNFAAKLSTYSAKYSISANEVTDMQMSVTCLNYWLDMVNKFTEFNKKLTSFKNELRDGLATGVNQSALPVPPNMGAVPTLVPPGAFKRAKSIAARIKNHPAYTEVDGKDMGIVGVESTVDLQSLKPVLSLRLIAGGKPEIVWAKGVADSILIYKENASGQFELLAQDNFPNYVDNGPLPPHGQSEVRRYKAIYQVHDEVVGMWSDVVSITVTGN